MKLYLSFLAVLLFTVAVGNAVCDVGLLYGISLGTAPSAMHAQMIVRDAEVMAPLALAALAAVLAFGGRRISRRVFGVAALLVLSACGSGTYAMLKCGGPGGHREIGQCSWRQTFREVFRSQPPATPKKK